MDGEIVGILELCHQLCQPADPFNSTVRSAASRATAAVSATPTANLAVDTTARDGVYFGFADLGDFSHHPSIIFVGIPTTVGDTKRRVEAYLIDIPDVDHYDQPLKLSLERYHRSNRTFADTGELVAAMKADEAAARQWFAARQP